MSKVESKQAVTTETVESAKARPRQIRLLRY